MVSTGTALGIIFGILIVLWIVGGAVYVHFRWGLARFVPAFLSRRISGGADTLPPPTGNGFGYARGYREKWDTVASRDGSLSLQGSIPGLSDPSASRHPPSLPEKSTSINPAGTVQQASLPPLEPNRRLPPAPLPRLEPNRRKPSLASIAALGATHDADVAKGAPSPPQPPLPPPKLDLTDELDPVTSTPPATADRVAPLPPAIPALVVPKPTRRSRGSALTSASTALGDMPLLRPSPVAGALIRPVPLTAGEVDRHRTAALERLDAIVSDDPVPSSPTRPPRVIPVGADIRALNAAPSPAPSADSRFSASTSASAARASRTSKRASTASSMMRKPVPPLEPHLANPPVPMLSSSASTVSSLSTVNTVFLNPVEPPTPTPEHTQFKTTSKPVSLPSEPFTSLDATSGGAYPSLPFPSPDGAASNTDSMSIWTRRYSDASTLAWGAARALDSPVPSSSASQMYRTRDSLWSDWAAGASGGGSPPRTFEEWEREQLAAQMGLGLGRSGSQSQSQSRRASASRSQRQSAASSLASGVGGGFGEMKPMRSVIPDVPPLPREFLP